MRRRIDRACSLFLHLGIGWWLSFLVLVVALGFRMTPPRGDNWSGCLGMTAGLLVYCWRHKLSGVAWAALTTGILGGIGFAAAAMLKLVEITCGYTTNWHSIMEQTDGLFHGLALAASMTVLAARAPKLSDDPPLGRWTEPYAVSFVLLVITYLNLRKNTAEWVRAKAVPPVLYGVPAQLWFDLTYLALALSVIWLLARHLRKGVITLNAVICTLIVPLAPAPVPSFTSSPEPFLTSRMRRSVTIGVVLAALSILADWGVVRAIWGDRFAGPAYSGFHIRFGPRATTGHR
jgi:hypothetical protein